MGRVKRSTYIIIPLLIVSIYSYLYFFNKVIQDELTGGLLVFHIIMALIVIFFVAGKLFAIRTNSQASKGSTNQALPETPINGHHHSHSFEEIKRRLKLLKESYEAGILNDHEYETKKNKLKNDEKAILKNEALKKEFYFKKQKMRSLLEKNIISREEFGVKLEELKQTYSNKETGFEITMSDFNYYYNARGKEYGPITAESIIALLKNKTIKPETYVRLENEKLYSRKAQEIKNAFE